MTYVEKFHKTSKKIQVFETVRFVKMVQRGYEEILKNQHFYDFTTSPRVNKSQQVGISFFKGGLCGPFFLKCFPPKFFPDRVKSM